MDQALRCTQQLSYTAATLSLFDNDPNHNIELILIDSKETPQEAAKAFKEVIDRKIKIVIGPIFSTSVEAIEEDAKANQTLGAV